MGETPLFTNITNSQIYAKGLNQNQLKKGFTELEYYEL